jgi:hypothetical protein
MRLSLGWGLLLTSLLVVLMFFQEDQRLAYDSPIASFDPSSSYFLQGNAGSTSRDSTEVITADVSLVS